MNPEVIGSALGALIAIVGAVLIFFLKEWWKQKTSRNDVKKNCLKELVYNREMIEAAQKSVNKMIEELAVGKTSIYFTHSSSNIISQSIATAYTQGLLHDALKPHELATLNGDALTFFGRSDSPIETYISNQVIDWQSGKISQQELYGALIWVRDKAESALNTIDRTIIVLSNQKVQ